MVAEWSVAYERSLRKEIDERLETVLAPDWAILLDDHQQEAMLSLSCALEGLSENVRQRAFSVVHNTGAGKTLLAGNVLLASQAAKNSSELGGVAGWTSRLGNLGPDRPPAKPQRSDSPRRCPSPRLLSFRIVRQPRRYENR